MVGMKQNFTVLLPGEVAEAEGDSEAGGKDIPGLRDH